MKLFDIWIQNPLKTYNKVKKYWKPMKFSFKISTLHCMGDYYAWYGKILDITSSDVMWKDKYNSPRHEYNPYIQIVLFNTFVFKGVWKFELNGKNYDDPYWESILDYLYYNFKTPYEAVNNNIWTDMKGNKTPVLEFLR